MSRFVEIKRELDPGGLMQSDLYRRILEPYANSEDAALTSY